MTTRTVDRSTLRTRGLGGRELAVAGARYEIVVRGRLGDALTRSFRDLDVRAAQGGGTAIRGWFVDQAALQGLLHELADLGLELRSLRQLPDPD